MSHLPGKPRDPETPAPAAPAEVSPALALQVLESMPFDVAVLDAEGRFRYVNPNAVRDPEVRRWLIGKTDAEYCRYRGVDPAIAERRMRWIAKARDERRPVAFEEVLETATGPRHLRRMLVPVLDDDGAIRQLIGYGYDVTERRQDEAALRRSEAQYRDLFERIKDAVYISSPEGRLLDINPAGLEMLGILDKRELAEIEIGRDIYLDPWERDHLRALIAEHGFVKDQVLHLKTRAGRQLTVECTTTAMRDEQGAITAYLGVLRDVTAHRKLEEQLRQSQKMEAVGRLVTGLSHDFNNLLTAINGYSDLLLLQLADGDPMRAYADEIRSAGQRAADLIGQLVNVGRRSAVAPVLVDLNRVARSLELLLRRLLGEDIRLVLRLDDDLPLVRVGAGQLEQALLNLALNAREAMPTGGTLSVATATVELPAGEAEPRGLAAGLHVQLTVGDTGVGIDPAVRDLIFEPFFTTKDGDGGATSGLGLSTVYATARQSGGFIEVDSGKRRGTTFRILLPAAAARPAQQQPTAGEAPVAEGAGETVLVVEDEMAVRQLVCRLLRDQGYRVLEAANADEALAISARPDLAIDLLLSDVVMPETSGPQLADRLAPRFASMRILFMSGYADSLTRGHGVDRDLYELLAKPFDPSTLVRKVRETLARPAAL